MGIGGGSLGKLLKGKGPIELPSIKNPDHFGQGLLKQLLRCLISSAKQPQQHQEEVDEIEVKGEGSHDG